MAESEALITTEDHPLAVTDEIRALEPPANNSPIEQLGQMMYLELVDGASYQEIACSYCKDVEVVKDMIRGAIENNRRAALHGLTLDRMLIKSYLLDNQLAELYENTPDLEVLTVEALHQPTGKPVPLKQQKSNRRDKTDMVKERRQILAVQKTLIAANTGEVGESDTVEKKEMREMLTANVGVAIRLLAQELKEEGREVGRLQAGQQQSNTTTIEATVIESEDGDA